MKKNMGFIDRMVRVIIAVIIAILYYNEIISGLWGSIALVVAAVFLLTSLVAICPLYSLFGWRTCPVENKTTGSTV